MTFGTTTTDRVLNPSSANRSKTTTSIRKMDLDFFAQWLIDRDSRPWRSASEDNQRYIWCYGFSDNKPCQRLLLYEGKKRMLRKRLFDFLGSISDDRFWSRRSRMVVGNSFSIHFSPWCFLVSCLYTPDLQSTEKSHFPLLRWLASLVCWSFVKRLSFGLHYLRLHERWMGRSIDKRGIEPPIYLL